MKLRYPALGLIAGLAAAQAIAQNTGDGPGGDSLGGNSRANPGIQNRPGGGPVKTPDPRSGKEVYRQICQACHMADAKGGTGAGTIPALAGNAKLGVAAYPITVVVRGKGGMPPFAGTLNPAEVAAVVTYVRTNFGNNFAKPVTEDEVKRLWVAPSASDH